MRLLRGSAFVVLLVGVPACRAPESSLAADRQLAFRGLRQTVQLVPAAPKQGDEVAILSVVTNRGIEPVAVESRICGLDTGGTLELVMNRMACAGYSQSVVLAPGDSVTASDGRVVSSPPGHYTLRVRQLVQPEAWLTVPVEVR